MEIKMQKYTRLATNDDLISIMKIIDNAKEFLKKIWQYSMAKRLSK